MNRDIQKKILNEDVSDYSKKNILARTEEEQSIFLAHLMWYRDQSKEMESKVTNPHVSVIYANRAYFCEQQISKIKRWLSDEDFQLVEEIAKPEIVKLIKADKLWDLLTPIVALLVFAIAMFLFIYIIFSDGPNSNINCANPIGDYQKDVCDRAYERTFKEKWG